MLPAKKWNEPVIKRNGPNNGMKWSQRSNKMVLIIEWNAPSNLMKCPSNPMKCFIKEWNGPSNPMKCFQQRNEMAPAI